MIQDKERWNIRHVEKPMPHYVAPTLEKYIKEAYVGLALDVACGTGRKRWRPTRAERRARRSVCSCGRNSAPLRNRIKRVRQCWV